MAASADVKHIVRWLAEHPEAAEPLRRYLEQWETRHPRVAPTHRDQPLTAEEREQLRALGYIR